MHYPIALKFSTLIGAHPDTKFGCDTINSHEIINNYLQKITPICCHAYTEIWQGEGVTIEPQMFCYLKEIELKIMKIQRKT